jgi:hypothetical protein
MLSTISSVFSAELDGDSATPDAVADCGGGAGATGANGVTAASWSERVIGESDANGMGEGTDGTEAVSLVKGANATLALLVAGLAALML